MLDWIAQRSFRVKLAAIVLLAEAMMLAVILWQGLHLVAEQSAEEVRQRIEQVNPLLNAAVAVPLVQRDYTALQDVVAQALVKESLDYLVVEDRNGKWVASTGLAWGQPIPPASHELTFDSRHLDIRRPVVYMGEELGTVQYGVPLQAVEQARQRLTRQVLRSGAGRHPLPPPADPPELLADSPASSPGNRRGSSGRRASRATHQSGRPG